MRFGRALAAALMALGIQRASALPPALQVRGDPAGCPSPVAVARALAPLLPGVPIQDQPNAMRVEVSDRGTSYRITLRGIVREFLDPPRDCEERARASAVVIALAVDPLHLNLSPPPIVLPATPPPPKALPPPPIPPPSPPAPPLKRSLSLIVEAAGRGDFGLASGPSAWGAELRVVLGRGRWAGTLGIAGLAPTTLALESGLAVHLIRVPSDLSLRVTGRRGRFELAGELGLAGALIALQAEATPGLMRKPTQWLFDVGLRGAVAMRLHLGRAIPFVSLAALVSPSAPELSVLPQGVIGRLPVVWLSLSAGIAIPLQ